MREKIKQIYNNSTFTAKIRYSYILLLVPIVAFLIFCFYNLWAGNREYSQMINSAVAASEFSLDFKKDFDYETYLLIVGNKTIEESELHNLLEDANLVVAKLESLTDSQKNSANLESVKKYLNNLEDYVARIEENIQAGNKYEDNIEIWENDIQIVTSLLRETIFQYIYYEIRDIQSSSAEYQNFFMTMIRFSFLAFGIILLLIVFLSYYIPLSITQPVTELCEVTDQVAKGDLSVRSTASGGAEVNMLSDSLNAMIDKINDLLERITKEQVRLRKAEFELLQSQINPHFLYNTLDTIIWLAESGEQEEVVSMVGSLSDFFRTSLNQGKEVVSIREEIMHVRSYLEIQQVRYRDILEYEIDVAEELDPYLIPKITMQPLVENALYHGIKNKRGVGKITVTGKPEKHYFLLQISDNGIGMTDERMAEVKEGIEKRLSSEKNIYGLYNVNERIRLNFGEEYGVHISSVYGEGTTVAVKLPYNTK